MDFQIKHDAGRVSRLTPSLIVRMTEIQTKTHYLFFCFVSKRSAPSSYGDPSGWIHPNGCWV